MAEETTFLFLEMCIMCAKITAWNKWQSQWDCIEFDCIDPVQDPHLNTKCQGIIYLSQTPVTTTETRFSRLQGGPLII